MPDQTGHPRRLGLRGFIGMGESQSLLATVALIFAATLFAFLSTRWLPAHDRGVIVVLLTTSALSMLVGTLGVNVGGRRLLARPGGLNPPLYLAYTRRLTAAYLVTSSTLGLAVLWLSGGLVAWWAAPAFVIFTLPAFFGFMSKECLHGVGRHVAATYVDVVPAVSMLLFILLTEAVRGLTLPLAVAAVVFGVFVEFLYVRLQIRRYDKGHTDGVAFRELVRISLPALGSTLGNAAVVRGDRLILGAMAGTAPVGVYGLAATFSELLWIVPSTIAQFVFRGAALTSDRTVKLRAWAPVMGLTAVTGLGLTFLGMWIIESFFGADYAQASSLLPLLVVAALPMASFYLDSAALNGMGEYRTVSRITYAGVGLLCLASLVLIPTWGVTGAAVASIVSYATMGFTARFALLRSRSEPGVVTKKAGRGSEA